MSDDTQSEVDRLVSIARLHAWNALARAPSERDSHLATCRGFWRHYAEAFTTSEAECEGFADSLERATRDLMAEMQRNIATIREAGGFRRFEDAARLQPDKAPALTLDELRPIFRQIIGE
ncbi:MAG TPA: hypothetical protein VHA35_22470 [Dongiaceae bacterium]|jgi:hypothetical protein|nr:hypothetical protein [Dongiaceae bacterium]